MEFYTFRWPRGTHTQKSTHLGRASGLYGLFAPGIFFVLLGLVVVFAPGLILAAISAFLLFVGSLLLVVAYKFWSFQREIKKEFSHLGSFETSKRGAKPSAGRSGGEPEVEVLGPEEDDQFMKGPFGPKRRVVVRRSKVTYH